MSEPPKDTIEALGAALATAKAQLDDLRRKYSDDQPRAANGEFGSGGLQAAKDKAEAASQRAAQATTTASTALGGSARAEDDAAKAHQVAADAHAAVVSHKDMGSGFTQLHHAQQARGHARMAEGHRGAARRLRGEEPSTWHSSMR